MIAKRIRHKGICDHAPAPYARRKCRAAKLAAAGEEKLMEKPRYRVDSGKVGKGILYYVIDIQAGEEVYRTRLQAMAEGRVESLNRKAAEAPATAARPAPAPDGPTGWSKAARRRAGRSTGGHPLGRVVERGDGYTEYEDGTFGGGRVQIWDHS